jgi:hypothetical protein
MMYSQGVFVRFAKPWPASARKNLATHSYDFT